MAVAREKCFFFFFNFASCEPLTGAQLTESSILSSPAFALPTEGLFAHLGNSINGTEVRWKTGYLP